MSKVTHVVAQEADYVNAGNSACELQSHAKCLLSTDACGQMVKLSCYQKQIDLFSSSAENCTYHLFLYTMMMNLS